MKIMLVDDNESNNFFHRIMMGKVGYVMDHVICYNSAEKAIADLNDAHANNEKTPDVILLDINMPYVNGWEFLKRIRPIWEDDRTQFFIYLVSNSRHPEDIKKAEAEVMVTAILEKHLDQDFFEKLKSLMD